MRVYGFLMHSLFESVTFPDHIASLIADASISIVLDLYIIALVSGICLPDRFIPSLVSGAV